MASSYTTLQITIICNKLTRDQSLLPYPFSQQGSLTRLSPVIDIIVIVALTLAGLRMVVTKITTSYQTL